MRSWKGVGLVLLILGLVGLVGAPPLAASSSGDDDCPHGDQPDILCGSECTRFFGQWGCLIGAPELAFCIDVPGSGCVHGSYHCGCADDVVVF
jgi:hypothetical protein